MQQTSELQTWNDASLELSKKLHDDITIIEELLSSSPIDLPDPEPALQYFPIQITQTNYPSISNYSKQLQKSLTALSKRIRAVKRAADWADQYRLKHNVQHNECIVFETETSGDPTYCFWCKSQTIPDHINEYESWSTTVVNSLSKSLEEYDSKSTTISKPSTSPPIPKPSPTTSIPLSIPKSNQLQQQQQQQQQLQQLQQQIPTQPPLETKNPSNDTPLNLTTSMNDNENSTQLQITIQQQQDEIFQLKSKLDQREQELNQCRRDLSTLQSQLTNQQQQSAFLQKLQQENTQLTNRAQQADIQIQSLTRQLNDQQEYIQSNQPSKMQRTNNTVGVGRGRQLTVAEKLFPPQQQQPPLLPPPQHMRNNNNNNNNNNTTNNTNFNNQSHVHPSVKAAINYQQQSNGQQQQQSNQNNSEQQRTHIGPIELNPDGSLPQELHGLEIPLIEAVLNDMFSVQTGVSWDDVAGLSHCKQAIQETITLPVLRPDLFSGLREPPKGLLLFGPPGTGKTMLGKAVAQQCSARFFSVSSSSLTSKWFGQGEKMVKTLFSVCRYLSPCVLFIDEVDSILTARTEGEQEAGRRLKTEMLVQMDGMANFNTSTTNIDGNNDYNFGVIVIAATNLPKELDGAAFRRFTKRLYVPLPGFTARKQLVTRLLSKQTEGHDVTLDQIDTIARLTKGFSAADVRTLCSEASMISLREVQAKATTQPNPELYFKNAVIRKINFDDFQYSITNLVRPTVSSDTVDKLYEFNCQHGSFQVPKYDDEGDESSNNR